VSIAEGAKAHVLIVSTMLDVSTDAVVRELDSRGVECTRLNTETYPFATTMTLSIGGDVAAQIELQRESDPTVRSVVPTSVWFRRVRQPLRPSEMSSGVYDFCLREARSTLLGVVDVSSARIMSPPDCVWRAEHKVVQLSVARECGLLIPETVVTNEPAAVEAAFHRFKGRMIAKPARSGFVDYGDEQHAVYTTQIHQENLVDLEGARWSPVIYQELIEKRCDVRATYVGGSLFVAEIDSQTDPDARIDWRRTSNPQLPHRVASLPGAVEDRVRTLMARLGLQFGALDFVRTLDDEYVFLEVNPNGQWLWLEDQLGFRISGAIADWLAA
jgi:glutathione synthase/RimK-type ligase-like ATP-grasp enzyme